jgi:hypothetical protein
MWILCSVALASLVLAGGSGCAYPWDGKRDVKTKINILGNTIEWESRVTVVKPVEAPK